jgi:glycosyltransferase involved in cell wall biosynthesis
MFLCVTTEVAIMSGAKVCILFPHLVLGGGETAMMEVADGLQRYFDVSVCALERRKAAVAPTIAQELGARFETYSLVGSRDELTEVLRKIDLLLWYGTNDWTPNALNALPRRPGSIRVVHTDKKEEGLEFCARWRSCIDAVSCVSPVVQRQIPGSVSIPNTVSQTYLSGERREIFPLNKARGRKTLGFLGRLFSFKNVQWLVENIDRLGCNLMIQGLDTEELGRADLEALSVRLGIADRVRFLEPSRDVGTILRSIDALAILSRHEGFPMVAVEAGMVGTPVIATRVGALPELFPDAMLFVDLEQGFPSVDCLRVALSRVNADWGERLRRKVTALCSRDVVLGGYAKLVRSVLNGHRPHGGSFGAS